MRLEIECPSQFQGNVVGDLNARRGLITVTETIGSAMRIGGEILLAEAIDQMVAKWKGLCDNVRNCFAIVNRSNYFHEKIIHSSRLSVCGCSLRIEVRP